MIIQQCLARLFNSHWHYYSTVAGTIVQQSRERFSVFSMLAEFFNSDVHCWRIVPCTRNTTHDPDALKTFRRLLPKSLKHITLRRRKERQLYENNSRRLKNKKERSVLLASKLLYSKNKKERSVLLALMLLYDSTLKKLVSSFWRFNFRKERKGA